MDLDAILPDVGEFGTYQKCILALVLLPSVFPCGFHAYNQIFMAATPPHWCAVPQMNALNQSLEWIRHISVPFIDNNTYHSCEMYVHNYTHLVTIMKEDLGRFPTELRLSGIKTEPCRFGWQFDHSEYDNTVVVEWQLVCDRKYLTTFSLVLFGVGGLIGNYIFGVLQDSIGRRPVFFIFLFIECFFGIATAFARSFFVWCVLRFGVGFTIPAILGTPYVLGIEMVGPKYRTVCTILINIAYSVALVTLSGVVYFVREWRHLALATTLPFLAFFSYWWILPESPRWLLSQERFEEAEKILKKMAFVNGNTLNENYFIHIKRQFQVQNINEIKSPKTKTYHILDLLKTPNLRRNTLLITFIWFTNTSVYVGLSYYAPTLGGSEYFTFFLAGLVELPTYLVLWPAMEHLGRRWILFSSMAIGGLACIATIMATKSYMFTLVLYLIGKMGISCSFVVVPLVASEIYPTVVRGLGMSASSVVGMLGPIFIPLVNHIGTIHLVIPLFIMGVLLIGGALCALFLPETFNKHLPQTLEDGETFTSSRICTSRVKNILEEKNMNSL